MSLFLLIENWLERIFSGTFKIFKSSLEPVEIISALKKEMDIRSSMVSKTKTITPNLFFVEISEADAPRLLAPASSLHKTLLAAIQSHASSQSYAFQTPPEITISHSPNIKKGDCKIQSEFTNSTTAPNAYLHIGSRNIQLQKGATTIGRGKSAHIIINDTSVSRIHAKITWDGSTATIEDLSSTNGTWVNSHKITHNKLIDNSKIKIGETEIIFTQSP